MLEIKTNCYEDTKVASKEVKLVEHGKICKTFEQREAKYLPFHRKVEVPQQIDPSRQVEGERQSTIRNSSWYDWAAQVRDNVSSIFSYAWEKKSALLLGVMLASARGLGAEARLQRGGTALGLLDSSNATGLPPALDWRGINPVNRTALPEFDPNRVPPGFTDYLRKVGASESLIRKVERQNARRQLSELEQVKNPRSNTPPSVDCIKECTTTVSSNPSACLDVSASEVVGRVEPSVFGVPGQQVHLDFNLNVQNNCPQPIKDVTYQVAISRACPPDHPFLTEDYTLAYNANQNLVDVGALADAQNSTSVYCLRMKGESTTVDSSSLPSGLSVDISASGTDATANAIVSSQEKIFAILGNSPWTASCDLHCPQPSSSTSRRLGTMQVLLRGLATGIPLAYTLAERFRW